MVSSSPYEERGSRGDWQTKPSEDGSNNGSGVDESDESEAVGDMSSVEEDDAPIEKREGAPVWP